MTDRPGTRKDVDPASAGELDEFDLAWLAAIVRSSEDGIIGKNLDGVIVSWNPGAERIYGYQAEEVIGKHISILAPPDRFDEIPHILNDIRAGGRVEHLDTERITKDGRRINVSLSVSPVRDSREVIVGAATIARDITRLKNAEQALRESERRFRSTLDSLVTHIAILDETGAIQYTNLAWRRFAEENGCTIDPGMIGVNYFGVCDDASGADAEIAAPAAEGIREVAAGKRDMFTLEYPCHSPTQMRWFNMRATRFTDEGPVRVVLEHENITDRKQSELALEEVYLRERRIAETLQRSFLPDTIPAIEGYRLADSYSAALDEAAIGGDVYDVFRHPNGDFCMVIADVSGKGLEAARYGAVIKYMLRAYAYQMEDPADVLRVLNDSVLMELDIDIFVTCFLGVLNPETGQFLYANAGHDEPLYISRKTGKPVRLSVTGCALGVRAGATYSTESLRLALGDIIFMYTDGVTDARGAEEKLGVEGLEKYLEAHCNLSAKSLVECVLAEVRRRSGDRLADDVAMLAIEAIG